MARRRVFGSIIRRDSRPGFTIRFPYKGKTTWRRVDCSRAEARRRLDKVRVLLQDGLTLAEVDAQVFGRSQVAVPATDEVTFQASIPHYMEYAESRKKPSTFEVDKYRLRVLCKARWASKPISQVPPGDLEAWASARKKDGNVESSVNRYLALVSAVYQWAILKGLAEQNPARRVPKYSEKGRGREVFLTLEECSTLIDAAEPAFKPVLVTAIFTGMRRGEILGLRWRSVDFERHLITVEPQTAKSSGRRVVPMSVYLGGVLRELRESRKVVRADRRDRVFGRVAGRKITKATIRKMMAAALGDCDEIPEEKLSNLTFHDLRHTAASLMVAAGVSIFDVCKILGHSSPTITMRYAHFAPDNAFAARAGLDKIGQALGQVEWQERKVGG